MQQRAPDVVCRWKQEDIGAVAPAADQHGSRTAQLVLVQELRCPLRWISLQALAGCLVLPGCLLLLLLLLPHLLC
jgi:hypothetical protein